jgi:hypothetical protein
MNGPRKILSKTSKREKLRPGDLVTVRSPAAIASTLDATGAHEGLPFLPEMVRYCGQTFTVRRRIEKLIQEGVGSSMRRIKNVVLLEGTLCNGQSHGYCQRACFPLWKTAWLTRLDGQENASRREGEGEARLRASLPQGRGCQVTELMRATTPLPVWHPVRHILELRSRTYSPVEYGAYILGGVYRKTLKQIVDRMAERQNTLRSRSTPSPRLALPGDLGLRSGDLIEVRSVAEIKATLDAKGMHRGLYFMPGMWVYCGHRLRVLQPVDRMMSEKTGQMRAIDGVFILEGVTCDGKAHGGCQRGCFLFWKDAWLKQVVPD